MKILRTITIILAWLAASYGLCSVLVELEFHWNFFNWSPKLDAQSVFFASNITAILGCLWFLTEATRDRVSQVVAVLICLLLTALAIVWVHAEPLTGGILGRTAPSPLWYRLGCSLMLCVPGMFWLRKLRHRSSRDNVA
jgi:hypothetical protein